MKTIYKTTLSIFLFSILMVFGAKTAMGANLLNHCVDSNLCFNTLYQGKVSQLKSIIADNVPIEIETYNVSGGGGSGIGIHVTPKKGFKITNRNPDEKTGTVSLVLLQEMTEAPILMWDGDSESYPINYDYEIINPQTGSLSTLGEMIAVATPTTCLGGDYYPNTCTIKNSYEGQYEVFECPFQEHGFVCPGYELTPGFSGDLIENPKVLLKRIIPPVGVTVYGWDPKEDKEYTESMTVASTENNEANVRIYWRSENATSCKCTTFSGGIEGDCGIGVSLFINVPVPATGEGVVGPNGDYALTETTTFKVTCDND